MKKFMGFLVCLIFLVLGLMFVSCDDVITNDPTPPPGPGPGPGNNDFVAVTSITGVPDTGNVGTFTLGGTVNPSNATNRTITWSVLDEGTTGASISGAVLTTIEPGIVMVRASITNGTAV